MTGVMLAGSVNGINKQSLITHFAMLLGISCKSRHNADNANTLRRRLHNDTLYEYRDFCIRLHRGDAAFTPIRFRQRQCTLL